MLKGIDPLLTPELLEVLAAMGHAGKIVIAATSLGAGKPVVTLTWVDVQRAREAVLSPLPRDVAVAKQREPIAAPQACGDVRDEPCAAVERFAFYHRVRKADAIVHTGEMQPLANVLPKYGVIGEALRS